MAGLRLRPDSGFVGLRRILVTDNYLETLRRLDSSEADVSYADVIPNAAPRLFETTLVYMLFYYCDHCYYYVFGGIPTLQQ